MIHPDKIFGRLGNRMFQMAYIYAQMKEGNIPDIFLQDPKYFEKHDRAIKELYGDGIGFLPYVSIHVRRGSNPINPNEPKYCENPFYVDLTKREVDYDLGGSTELPDYYDKAIAMFPVDKFLVFSDDVAYCKGRWGENDRFQIMEMGDEIEDFNLMASCSIGNIIANSSFSWWAAYLNPSPSKLIIAPKQWYKDEIQRTKLPTSWKVL